MSGNEKQTILCVAFSRDVRNVVPGSRTISAGCGHRAVASKSSADMIERGEAVAICTNCLSPEDAIAQGGGAAPGAIEEVAAHLGVPVETAARQIASISVRIRNGSTSANRKAE